MVIKLMSKLGYNIETKAKQKVIKKIKYRGKYAQRIINL